MEGENNIDSKNEPNYNSKGDKRSESQQFSSYHPNPNFRPKAGGSEKTSVSLNSRALPSKPKRNQIHESNNKHRDVLSPKYPSNTDQQKNLEKNSNWDQKNQTKENERKKTNNQTSLSSGKSTKKSKSNRRKNLGKQIETKQILNSEENEPENQFDSNKNPSTEVKKNSSIHLISLENFNGQKLSPNKSPQTSNVPFPHEEPVNSFQPTNDIKNVEFPEIEVPCNTVSTNQYQVASTDPLAEIFKHAATCCADRTQISSEDSFYSTPLNHVLPAKYQGFDTVQAASLTSSDVTVYFSAEPTLSHTLCHNIMTSSTSSSSLSPDNNSMKLLEQQSNIIKAHDDKHIIVSTASEEERSFTIESYNENTITNGVIETSQSNENEKTMDIKDLTTTECNEKGEQLSALSDKQSLNAFQTIVCSYENDLDNSKKFEDITPNDTNCENSKLQLESENFVKSVSNNEIRNEVQSLIETVVSNAIIQAMTRGGVPNDSLIEININETITNDGDEQFLMQSQNQGKNQTYLSQTKYEPMIEPLVEENFGAIKEARNEKMSTNHENQQNYAALEKDYLLDNLVKDETIMSLEKKEIHEKINESNASISSSANMNLTDQKKNPIVDCFSCNIL